MHRTYLFPHMDEASNLLEEIIVPQQRILTCYHKLSLKIPLVDQVVNPSPSLVDPTLPLKSEFKSVDPVPTSVYPTLPWESEVKLVKSMSSLPDHTLSSDSVKTELVTLTQSSSCPSLLVESELKPVEVFVVSFNFSMQEEILSLST